ncbi:MAG: hypothetical protein ABI145_08100 [Steroidobacteraceae bacterium]
MTNKTGIWIDHRKAVIVTVLTGGEQIETISSNVEKHPERSGDSPLKGRYEAQQVPADDKRQRALTGHMNAFYDTVIGKIAAADTVFIFGPGEAKGELKRRLEHHELGSRVRALETADKLTDQQISAKVRQHFNPT